MHVVSDASGLERTRELVLSSVRDDGRGVLGIDAEWCAAHDVFSDGGVQWLQLATVDRAFLLDVPALIAACPSHLDACLSALMGEPRLLKLGYGLRGDLLKVRAAHASLGSLAPDRVQPAADLAGGQRNEASGGQSGGEATAGGLSQLVAETLGRPLDKQMRMTNWERRPLVAAQIEYAALDAHCLVLVYGVRERRRLLEDAASRQPSTVPPREACRDDTCSGLPQPRDSAGCLLELSSASSGSDTDADGLDSVEHAARGLARVTLRFVSPGTSYAGRALLLRAAHFARDTSRTAM